MKNVKLFIVYYFDGYEKNACNYVGKTGTEAEFLAYAKSQDWLIDKSDIDGVYEVKTEDDKDGNEYKIKVILK